MVGVLQYNLWLEDDMLSRLFFTHPKNPKPIGNEAELRYKYNLGKKNCLTIIGNEIFADPGSLSFFFFEHCSYENSETRGTADGRRQDSLFQDLMSGW